MLHITLEKGQEQPDGLWQILNRCTPLGPWVCGGAARRLYFEELLPDTSDVDVFCKTSEQSEEIIEWLMDQGATTTERAKGSITFAFGYVRVQIVQTRFPNLEAVLNSFDFRMCMFGCDGEQITFAEWAPGDVLNKVLVLNKVKLPLYTLARIQKYSEQGFIIPTSEIHGMVLTLAMAAREQLAQGAELGYGDL